MRTKLYCTLCGQELHVIEHDLAEANLACKNGHRWWYSPVELDKGNFLVIADVLSFQCDMGAPCPGVSSRLLES